MAPKRKATPSGKARKVQKMSVFLAQEEVQKLASEAASSPKHYNHLVKLIEQYQHIEKTLKEAENDEIETLGRVLTLALFKCFQLLHTEGAMNQKKTSDERKQLVAKWLLNQYETYKKQLLRFVTYKLAYESSLQVDVLEVYLNLVKLEAGVRSDSFFPTLTYKNLVCALLESECGSVLSDGLSDNFLLLELAERFQENWDLQFYFFNGLHKTLSEWKSAKNTHQLRRVYAVFFTLTKNGLMYENDEEILASHPTFTATQLPQNAYKPAVFRLQYQKTLTTILLYPLLAPQYKQTLLVLQKRVIPYLGQPQALMDFLTDAYSENSDDVVPILALNSLYELMKRYNLEYPDFYTKLYLLLTPTLLYSRYRSRFFRLCDLFLSSTHLSSLLIASFIKRMARLALLASASGVVIVIPFVYNLLKRHPSCMVMIHRPEATEANDTFDNLQPDPLHTGAMGLSLWELETLMAHYHPNIATLAKIFGEPFRKASYNMEDFLDWSYVLLLESESTRKYRSAAALEFQEWDLLFERQDRKETETVYARGWTL